MGNIRGMLSALWLLTLSSQASDVGPFRVFTEDFPPYQIQLGPNKVSGAATQLVTQLFNDAGIDYHINVLPWYRSYHDVLKEPNSFIYSLARIPEREQLFEWVMPLCDLEVSFFWLAQRDDIKINSLDDVRPFVVSVASGQPSETFLLSHAFSTDNNLVILASHEQGLGLLEKGRVDMVFAADLFIGNIMETAQKPNLKLKKFTLPELSKTMYLAANLATDKALLNKLRAAANAKQLQASRQQICKQAVGHYLSE